MNKEKETRRGRSMLRERFSKMLLERNVLRIS